MSGLSRTRPERQTWAGVPKVQRTSLPNDSPRAIARRSIEVFQHARSRLSTRSSGSYISSLITSPTDSARTTSRKSASNVITTDPSRSKEEDSGDEARSDEEESNDAITDIITDGGEALRAELWLRHQTTEGVQSTHTSEKAVVAPSDPVNLSKDDSEASSGGVSEERSRENPAATLTKDTEHEHDLSYRLSTARVRNVNGRSFIPVDTIYELITPESVAEELQCAIRRDDTRPAFTRPIQQIAKDVCPGHRVPDSEKENSIRDLSRRKIFGILVSIGMSSSIEVFLDNDISDLDLPFTTTRCEGTTQVISSAGSRMEALSNLLVEHVQWPSTWMETFIERQWEFVAPFFTARSSGIGDEITHYRLSKDSVLPWISQSPSGASSRQGGFSKVTEVFIHPAHHNFGGNSQGSTSRSFAMKAISGGLGALQNFEKEVSALKHISRLGDRHLGKVLSTYEQAGTYYMIFPWADGGNLRDFWSSNRERPQIDKDITKWLITQIHGLVVGLGRIHDYKLEADDNNLHGRHGDLKPENILLFESPGTGLYSHRFVISDFGLSKFSKSANNTSVKAITPTYRPPEVDVSGTVSQQYDIWSLGCVFLELVVWMMSGWDGVEEKFPFARTMAFDLHDAQSKSFQDDSFFTFDKGVPIVKPTVSDWIKTMSEDHTSSPWIRDMLILISTSLLVVNPETRMSAAQLAQVLQNMQDWGTSHPEYFLPGAANHQRMIIGPKLMRDIELETASGATSEATEISPRKQTTDHEQRLQRLENVVEAPTITMQLTGMKFTRCSEVKHQQSVLEKLQLQVEDYLGEQVDWWPLPPLERQKKGQHTELQWEYGGERMSIILNETETEKLSTDLNQAQGGNHRMNTLPIAQPRSYPSNDAQTPAKVTSKKPFWLRWIQYINQLSNTSKPNPPGSAASTGSTQMETYLCVDKCWTAIKDTRMRTVTAIDNMRSDFDFFCRARSLLNKTEGNWLQRKLSWRSYTSVNLSEFHFLFDDSDEVEVDGKPTPTDKHTFQGYHYAPIPGLGIDVQMRVCAEILLKGIAKPELGRGGRKLLKSMPKLLAPPGLNKKQFSSGWGFHARQGLCMRKTMGWIAAVLAFGIAFVPYWLCAIDELDLQTALAPVSFLATALGVGLAMLAIAHTR